MRPLQQSLIKEKPTNLFWTGGWDSTFRLLQLLLIEKKQVQPYYLIDPDRLSTGIEIRSMRDIKSFLYKEYPMAQKLLLSTKFMEISDIQTDNKIKEAYETIKKQRHIGSQYDWLARFCKHHGIMDMELSVDKKSNPFNIISHLLEVKKIKFLNKEIYCFNNNCKTEPEFILFRHYQFPLLNLDKLLMNEIVKEQNWTELMDMTWFCHRPRKGQIPCGNCTPCKIAIKDGLKWRIPLSSRIYSVFYSILNKKK